jgi:hypothetical protein
MVSLNQVQNGFVKYIDNDLCPMLSGWKKWAFGAVSSLWLCNISETFQKLKGNAIVQMLGVIDESDMIDIDKLYREFYNQAQKGPATFDLPVVGALTIDKSDIERLYRYIVEG